MFTRVKILGALCLLYAGQAVAQDWTVTSPDGRTTVAIALDARGVVTWRAARDGSPVLNPSPIGIRRHDQTFAEGLKLLEAGELATISERYDMPHGKRRVHVVNGRQRTVSFANARNARFDVIVRAHDDGVAIRYRFPETDPMPRRVFEEMTGFAVPEGSRGWMQPHQRVHRYGPAYEEFYNEVTAGDTAPLAQAGWSLPALFRTAAGKWLLIHESALDASYAGAHLQANAPRGVYRVTFPDPEEGLGVGEIHPQSTLPWTMPWRVVVIGDSAGSLLESDFVTDLSPPSKLQDVSWIKPGRASWSWWSQSDSPKHAAHLHAFTDLCAEMGWEYALVDANWNQMQTGTIDEVIAHAKTRGVGLLLWYNSGGPHNDVTEAPRDLMHTRALRRQEFARLQAWGIKGIKVDFWHSEKPDRIRQYRELLEDAADFRLLVNLHGSTIPRGWSREYPHLMTMEGVFGAEQYKFREIFVRRAASHNTVLPFTRNVVGPMDYTPVTFSDGRFPRITTNAHELAQAVVFESGIQHYADGVGAYRALPDGAKQFLREVPAAWDETHALVADPGRSVAIARRAGGTWYVGGLNGLDSASAATLDLAFLGPGSWTVTMIEDGDGDRSFKVSTRQAASRDKLQMPMRPRGGFALRFAKAAERSSR